MGRVPLHPEQNHNDFTLIATAPFGLEGVVRDELLRLGIEDVKAGLGGARFSGTLSDVFRANLHLRCADRVLLVVGQFEAMSFDALFEGVKALDWARYIPRDAAFPVTGNCARSQLMSVRDCQAITKKAIVERLRATYRTQTLPETAETVGVSVSLHENVATLTLDTSGPGLSRRGYRTWVGEAPLRETLAASILTLSPWRPGVALVDPLCGTGTILLEAYGMARNRVPGIARSFACESWRWMPRSAMTDLRAQARAGEREDIPWALLGSDIDAKALELARRHFAQAGCSKEDLACLDRHLQCSDIHDVRLEPQRGVIVTNPPYGERLSDPKGCEDIARQLRRLQDESGMAVCALTAFRGFERAFGRRADKRRRLYNGRLECELMTFYPVQR